MLKYTKIITLTILLIVIPDFVKRADACSFPTCQPFSRYEQFQSKIPANIPGLLFMPKRPWPNDYIATRPFDNEIVSLTNNTTQDSIDLRVESVDSETYYIEFLEELDEKQAYTLTVPSICDHPDGGTTTLRFETLKSIPYPANQRVGLQLGDLFYQEQEPWACGTPYDSKATMHASVVLPENESFKQWNSSIHWKAYVNGQFEVNGSALRLEASCEPEDSRSDFIRVPGEYEVHFEGHLPGTNLTWRTEKATLDLDCRKAQREGCSQIHTSTLPNPLSWAWILFVCLLGLYRRATYSVSG